MPQESPTDLLQQLYHREQSLLKTFSCLYGALWVTALREGFGCGFYFLTFDTLRHNKFLKERTEGSKIKSLLHLIFSGSCSGMMYWVAALPFDSIKTRLQVAYFKNENVSFLEILKTYRFKQYYNGWQVAIGRGIPGAGTTLTIYTLVTEKLKKIA